MLREIAQSYQQLNDQNSRTNLPDFQNQQSVHISHHSSHMHTDLITSGVVHMPPNPPVINGRNHPGAHVNPHSHHAGSSHSFNTSLPLHNGVMLTNTAQQPHSHQSHQPSPHNSTMNSIAHNARHPNYVRHLGNHSQSETVLTRRNNSPSDHCSLDVYKYNLSAGIKLIRELVKDYPYVAVDTEFPGVVAKINFEGKDPAEHAYQNIRCNLDILKPIQIGFSFFNEKGLQAPQSTVQFNMKWDVTGDPHAIDSIRLLSDSGIHFEKLRTNGIDAEVLAENLMNSGLVLNDRITFIGYHSSYDWAYLLKVMTNWNSPPFALDEYEKYLRLYFPRIYDLKVLQWNRSSVTRGGLQELADTLSVNRDGNQHQAGSDAKLTGALFFRMIAESPEILDHVGSERISAVNVIFGLNQGQGVNLWVPNSAVNRNSETEVVSSEYETEEYEQAHFYVNGNSETDSNESEIHHGESAHAEPAPEDTVVPMVNGAVDGHSSSSPTSLRQDSDSSCHEDNQGTVFTHSDREQ